MLRRARWLRPRIRRALAGVAVLAVALGGAAIVAAPPSSAASRSYASLQLRGVGGNCLTADAASDLATVVMRACDPANTRQNWDVLTWDDGFRSGGGIALGNTGLCLGTVDNATGWGSLIVLHTCDPDANPSVQWVSTDNAAQLSPGVRSFYNPGSGRCLDVQYVSADQGTPVWLWDCNHDSDAQTWMLGPTSYTGPVLGAGEKCLTAPRSLPENSDLVWMATCDGSGSQRWARVNGYLMLGGKCLDVRDANREPGTPVQLYSCVDVPQQRWQPRASGILQSDLGDLCLDVQNGDTADGTPVWSWSCNETYAQGWYVGDLPSTFMVTEASATQLNGAMAARLGSCQGMISFTVDHVSIVAMRNPAPLLVHRSDGGLFTDAALTAGQGLWANRAAMNAQFFEYTGEFALAPAGDIYLGGQPVASIPAHDEYQGYYVTVPTADSCGTQWSIGPQDNPALGAAPEPNGFVMGGARPLIINRQKWGRTDEPLLHWPEAAGSSFLEYDGARVGKPTIGVRGDGIVVMMVQRDVQTSLRSVGARTLTEIRDAYWMLGFNDAVLFDPSTSSTLTVNGVVKVRPVHFGSRVHKDDQIPYGIGMATN